MAAPKKVIDVRSLARSYTELGIRTLANVMQHSDNDSARVAAVALMFDRGWGRPIGGAGEAAGELRVVIRQIVEHVGAERASGPLIEHQAQDEHDQGSELD